MKAKVIIAGLVATVVYMWLDRRAGDAWIAGSRDSWLTRATSGIHLPGL